MEKHWAYCPDRQGVCGVVVAHGEHAARDAMRIATLGADLDRAMSELDKVRAELDKVRAELDKALAERDHFRAEWATAQVQLDCDANDAKASQSMRAELERARAEARDLERENASLRRRLREGGR